LNRKVNFSAFIFSVVLIFTSCPNPMMEKLLDFRIISFDTNGGSSVPEQRLLRGELLTKPENPERESFLFVNWIDDNDVEWNFNTIPGGDMILYAGWLRFGIYFSTLDTSGVGNLGSVGLGYNIPPSQTITVTNNPASELDTGLMSITVSGVNAGSFSISKNSLENLEPGESEDFVLSFLPVLPAGFYTARVTVSNGSFISASFLVTMVVEKAAGSAVSTPVISGSDTSPVITVTTPSTLVTPTGQSIEYAISTLNNGTGLSVWQDGLVFSGLSAGAEYFVYARSKENSNYLAGPISASSNAVSFNTASIGITIINVPGSGLMLDTTENIVLYRTSNPLFKTVPLEITNAGNFINIQWIYNGIPLGSGASLVLNVSDDRYNSDGIKLLTITFLHNGVPESLTLTFTVAE